MMRIITGKARGTRLSTLEGVSTRPTSERVKEALFSMLSDRVIDAEVLDLFAGSGQLALEALSRGAHRAVLCDCSRDAVRILRSNAEKTHFTEDCEILCMDYKQAIERFSKERPFDLVFLDPPYARGLLPEVLSKLIGHSLLKDGCVVVCESASPDDVFSGNADLANRYEVLRVARYGAATLTLMTPKKGECT